MRSTIEQQVRTDAQNDPAFRAALIADPEAALEERYGVTIPASVTIRVIEESADEVVLTLPTADATVSEAQLDAVVGAGVPLGY